MAIFNTKEGKKDAQVAAKAPKKSAARKKTDAKQTQKKAHTPAKDAGAKLTKTPVRILKTPRITEKAAYMTLQNGYVFEVAQDATKRDVVAAIKALYQVTPRKVNIVVKSARAFVSRTRNRRGTKSGMKKAYVFLKKGDKIDLA